MADKLYKVVEFTPPGRSADEARYDKRYCVIDPNTGEILDDAQGYGYKTVQKAHAGYGYKTKPKAQRDAAAKRRRAVQKWLKSQKGLMATMEDAAFQIAKGAGDPDEKFDAKQVAGIMKDLGIVSEYKPGEILRAWEKMDW